MISAARARDEAVREPDGLLVTDLAGQRDRLDVSVRAQILSYLLELQQKKRIAMDTAKQ